MPQTVPFHVEHATALYIALNPSGITTFPAAGGTLEYTIQGGNSTPALQTVDIWVDITLPDSSIYGPVVGPVLDFTMSPGWSGDRDRELNIPGRAPEGVYSLKGYMGEYDPVNPVIYAEDHFEFSKTGVDYADTGPWFTDSGEGFEDVMKPPEVLPDSYVQCWCHPNPFNNVTTLSFQLLEEQYVTLKIYDISGRQVAELMDGRFNAGIHEISFDASHLASGIYLYRFTSGENVTSGKLVLLK